MPTYEYKCECGERFELLTSIAERNTPQRCKCGKEAKRNILSDVNLHGFDSFGRSKKKSRNK